MKKTAILGVAVMALVGLTACTIQPERRVAAIEAHGFTNVELDGWAWFACAEDDTYSYAFKALDARGRPVEGALCSGWALKGATVRLTSF